MSEWYDPELYALLHRGTQGDLQTYVKELAGASSVLELGCGYGRVLAGLARAYPQLELWGLDHHPGLLALARESLPSTVHLIEADMTSFDLGRSFDAVIAPYSTLWCLISDADLEACLRQAQLHLQSGGRFLMDAYSGYVFEDSEPKSSVGEDKEFVTEVRTAERAFRVFETSTWRQSERAFTVCYTHEPLDDGPPVEACIDHRYRLEPELRRRVAEAGFVDVETYDGFSGQPFHLEAEHLLLTAKAL